MDIETPIATTKKQIEGLEITRTRVRYPFPIFVIAILILVVVGAGGALDYFRIENAKQNLFAALDTSALYAASLTGKSESEMKELAKAYFLKNFEYPNFQDVAFELHDYQDRVEVTATVNLQTLFLRFVGWEFITLPAESEVSKLDQVTG